MLLDPVKGGLAEIRYRRLIRALASDVNPIPIKTAMAAMGLCSSTFRLPLCGSNAEKERELLAALKNLGGEER
jgi:4-hydroxy-tetrahydrodipicolinate synthase